MSHVLPTTTEEKEKEKEGEGVTVKAVMEMMLATLEMTQLTLADPSDQHGVYRALCPHCATLFEVTPADMNCRIFRHAVFRHSGHFVPPHASRAQCRAWVKHHQVWGCGGPLRYTGSAFEACDYL